MNESNSPNNHLILWTESKLWAEFSFFIKFNLKKQWEITAIIYVPDFP